MRALVYVCLLTTVIIQNTMGKCGGDQHATKDYRKCGCPDYNIGFPLVCVFYCKENLRTCICDDGYRRDPYTMKCSSASYFDLNAKHQH